MMGRRKLIYLAALAAAVAILLADRLLLGPPAVASAAPEPAAPGLALPVDAAGAAGAGHELQLPFPAGLQPAELGGTVRDPFLPTPEFAALVEAAAAARAADQNDDSDNAVVSMITFARSHQLKGVALTDTGGTAWVDDQAVDVGETYRGAFLMSVNSNEAHFQCADGVAVLRVVSPQPFD